MAQDTTMARHPEAVGEVPISSQNNAVAQDSCDFLYFISNGVMNTMQACLEQRESAQFDRDGFLFYENFLDRSDLDDLYCDLEGLTLDRSESTVLEKGSTSVRALHGSHLVSYACNRLSRNDKLLQKARNILKSDVYLYQFKINMKAAFVGEVWPWHQDYIYWRNEDGMASPDAVNVVVFLDEVTEFNGPLYLIPRSHAHGVIEPGMRVPRAGQAADWTENVSANLKYKISDETVRRLAEEGGLVAPKGAAGSVLLFHCNLVHGSAPNISPFSRRIAILTYNSVNNAPTPTRLRRPEFLVSRDVVAL